jgi:hypothetical protein
MALAGKNSEKRVVALNPLLANAFRERRAFFRVLMTASGSRPFEQQLAAAYVEYGAVAADLLDHDAGCHRFAFAEPASVNHHEALARFGAENVHIQAQRRQTLTLGGAQRAQGSDERLR